MIQHSNLVLSYMQLRKFIGILGFALPFVLVLGNMFIFNSSELESSMSEYYHTSMRNIFVGSLFSIGTFFFCYRGYDGQDNVAGNIAAISVFCIAIFPTAPQGSEPGSIAFTLETLHFLFSGIFIVALAYFCLRLFPKSSGDLTEEKIKRNKIYKLCGYCIVISVVLMGIVVKVIDEDIAVRYSLVLWLEVVAFVAFGISWMVKGEMIMKDNNITE